MVADWPHAFVLHSDWRPADGHDRYVLRLTSTGRDPVEGFRLAISGPARINEAAEIVNGRIVTQLSNYAELAPPPGFVLAPGASWEIEIGKLDYPLRHWTDGATTGFVLLADGSAVPAVTHPTGRAGSPPYRRGTMLLGADTDALLTRAGYSAEQQQALRASGAI